MAKNVIVVASCYGRRIEGIITGTPLPGTIMQVEAGTAPDSFGRLTYTAYSRDADGDRPRGPIFVLDKDFAQGKTVDDAYVSGKRGFLWAPVPGDELNVRWAAAGTGTGDAIDEGDIGIVDSGTGLVLKTVGTVESEPFCAMEAVTDVVSTGTLVKSYFTGY